MSDIVLNSGLPCTSDSRLRVRIIADGPATGPENMRRDLGMVESCIQEHALIVRTYSWDGPWVSLGKYQIEQDAITVGWDRAVKRPTGGRAVFHGHDLTVSVAVPLSVLGLKEGRSLRRIYLTLVRPIAEAIRLAGVEARVAADIGAEGNHCSSLPDCFSSAAGMDIVGVHGSKLCGCAMAVWRRCALIQASIPLAQPLFEPSVAIKGAGEVRPLMIPFKEMQKALQSTFLKVENVNRGSLDSTRLEPE